MRRLGLVGLVCSVALSALAFTGSPAQAFTLICSAKTQAQVAACDTSGYAAVMNQMHWRMYAGHNCTNYAAYRMKRAGVPEPRILLGNARDWATNARKLGYVVDQRPAVGAIAQWSRSANHVAYVEAVGPGYLILSEDSYTSKVYRRYRVEATDSWFPEAFIHFRDVGAAAAPMKAAVATQVSVAVPSRVNTSVRAVATVTVTTADGSAPVGVVRVRRGGVTVATATLTAASKGRATVLLPKLKRGTRWISAVYDGNASTLAATSRSARVVVVKPAKLVSSTTTVTAPATATVSDRVSVTVAVRASDARAVSNAVSVYVDGTRIAAPVLTPAARGVATVTLPALGPGRHTIGATYWGTKGVKRSFAAPRTITVTEPTAVTATVTAGTVKPAKATVVTATVTTARAVAPAAGAVDVEVDGVTAASAALTAAAKGTVRLTLPALTAGTHQVVVRYRGAGFQTASASVPATVVVR